jgi:hypothetical protein
LITVLVVLVPDVRADRGRLVDDAKDELFLEWPTSKTQAASI